MSPDVFFGEGVAEVEMPLYVCGGPSHVFSYVMTGMVH